MSVRRLSICMSVMESLFLNPNPHALTNGATVMSKAPPVFSDTLLARWKSWRNRVSVSTYWFLLMRLMVLCGLNVENVASTLSSAARDIYSQSEMQRLCKRFAFWDRISSFGQQYSLLSELIIHIRACHLRLLRLRRHPDSYKSRAEPIYRCFQHSGLL